MEMTLGLFIVVAVISLVSQYMDVSIGGGYGTALTPILLIIGFAPLDVVPAVLLGQVVGNIAGGYFHYRVGNIHLDFRCDEGLVKNNGVSYMPRSLDAKVVLILALSGVVGGFIGAFSAINIPGILLKVYIGVMVAGIGILTLFRRNHPSSFSFKRLVGVGLLSAFNKGISGGGYGPLVTCGQVLSGREVKNSIGSTTIAKALVCIVGFLSYVFLKGGVYWTLVAATSVGSVIAGPFGAITVKKLGSKKLTLVTGLVMTILGVMTLVQGFPESARILKLIWGM